MTFRKVFAIVLMTILTMAPVASYSIASEENNMKKNDANKESASAENPMYQNIPCNWEGWSKAYPEVDCKQRLCDRYERVIKMECKAGVVNEVKMDTVCIACAEF